MSETEPRTGAKPTTEEQRRKLGTAVGKVLKEQGYGFRRAANARRGQPALQEPPKPASRDEE